MLGRPAAGVFLLLPVGDEVVGWVSARHLVRRVAARLVLRVPPAHQEGEVANFPDVSPVLKGSFASVCVLCTCGLFIVSYVYHAMQV